MKYMKRKSKDPEIDNEPKYEDDAKDLLRLCHNLIAHAFDNFIRKSLKLSYSDLLKIPNSVFPGLLSDFENIMHKCSSESEKMLDRYNITRYQTVEDSIERKNDIKDCDRSCCCNLGRDYQYFEQPLACTHCHGRSVISLADYAKTQSVIIAYVPPGDTMNDTFVDAKIETLVILRGGARALGQIHRSGKSLGGFFNLSDLLLDRRLCVRFDSRKALVLQTSSDELNEADYAQYGIIVTRDFFGGQALPVDISRWICLLEDNPCQSVYLLEYSICLMEPRQAAGHFIWLYQHLGVLKTQGSRDYWFIIDMLTDRHPSWKVYLQETGKETFDLNALVKDIYRHNVEPGETPLFEDDARGSLRLCQNVLKHVLERSVIFVRDKYGVRRRVRKFSDRLILVIVKSVFSGLMVDFQELMHREGHLRRFCLEMH